MLCSAIGYVTHMGNKAIGNKMYSDGKTVMLEVDLDASPPTLHFFVKDREQRIFVTDIPQSINFAVCSICAVLILTLLQVMTKREDDAYAISLREVDVLTGRGDVPNAKEREWGGEWPDEEDSDEDAASSSEEENQLVIVASNRRHVSDDDDDL
jgi:hypothetical protein